MPSPETIRVEWFDNPSPGFHEALVTLLVAPMVLAVAVLYLALLPGDDFVRFTPLYILSVIGALAMVDYVRWRRRPRKVGFSADRVHLEYRDGTTRSIQWEAIGQVKVYEFLRLKHAGIKYADGTWEGRAHLYGLAAEELRNRFESMSPGTPT